MTSDFTTVTRTWNAYYCSQYQAETTPISKDMRGQLVEKISLNGLANLDDLDILSLAVESTYLNIVVGPSV